MGKNKNRTPRVVIITGCTSGIGGELARLYRENGDIVIGLARTATSPDIAVDVTDTAALKAAVTHAGEQHGRIDTVIACAGGGLSGATELIPADALRYQTDLNYIGAVTTVQAALPFMVKGGRAVFVSSACALFALPYRASYCASKAAVNMISYGMYMELLDSGIKVSAICPGDIKTGFTKNRVKLNDGGARYGDKPARCAQKIDGREDKRMELVSACKKIFKCAEKCNKPLYIVGGKYKLLHFAQRLLPTKLFLKATAKLFG